ncbi:hypothetical protein F5B22DRAFT_321268 [Xylaria bambusicola]|uniref:uncharacterized protein n=1 Tax=Xylaria bambusicola TaxID=326684 RepID=UPI0020076858|nr:uncharacterized protein F5B22DRAFT_321268 [Xylaria bambusicola]KAI0509466.1 hypothetical protein F5B22DRAFT_321268 [Xylaria bambusicola]
MRLLNLFNVLQLQFSLSYVVAATTASLPAKSVIEYALPAAAQTHEILPVSDHLLLISQQSDGGLLKVALDNNGRPTGARKWIITNQWSGLHGLTPSSISKRNSSTSSVWATVQFDNAILHIDPKGDDINAAPQVIKTIPIPAPAFGPHGILEHSGNLWVACKDSSHIVRINATNPSDHQIWAVSRRPIFVAAHPTSGDIYSGLDLDSKIWHYKNDGGNGEEIEIPAEKGSVPVGTVAGPDGNVWFVLLGNATGGTGTFGRINKDASIDWFTMTSAIGATAPLIHLAFDENPTRFWLLGSSITCKTCPDAVYTVKIDDISIGGTSGPRIAIQNTIMMPTQRNWNHRIMFHRGNLYITELITSTLAHISGAFIDSPKISEPWDQFAASGLGIGAQVVTYNNTAH